jgi:Lipopolysaccharide-assembly
MNRRIIPAFLAFPLICFCILLSGFFSSCGVYSFTGASIDPSVKTFTIKPFSNQASIVVPGLSQSLTDGLRNKIITNTSLSQSSTEGDLEYTGSIVTYSVAPSATTAAQVASLNRLTIAIQVDFTNHKNDKQSWTQTFSRYADYNSQQSLNTVQDDLIKQISAQLIDDIFNKSLVNW